MRLARTIIPLAMLAGCGDVASSKVDAGPETTRTFQVDAFEAIDLKGAERLVVHTGKPAAVMAAGPQGAVDRLEISTQSGRLLISRKKGVDVSGKGTTITVNMPKLTAMTVEGAGDISVDRVAGDNFSLVLAGAGTVDLGSAELKSIDMSLRGAGDIKASGRADRAVVETRGVGSFDLDKLVTRDLKVSVKGTGSVSANATGTAVVDLAGVGSVDISGGAKCTVTRKGIGSVSCQ